METAMKHKRNHVFCIIGLISWIFGASHIGSQMLVLLLPKITSKWGVGGGMGVFDGGSLEVFCRDPDFESLDRILKGERGSGILERETEFYFYFSFNISY